MKATSKVSNTLWTFAEVKTAAWLVKKGYLTQLERPITLAQDLDIASVSEEMEIIRKAGQAFVYFKS